MAPLNLVIRKRAFYSINRVAEWYLKEMGHLAAQHFVNDVYNAMSMLTDFPLLGTADEIYSTGKTKYYSFLFHSKYRIIYRFTDESLYVVAIRATMKNL